MTSFRNQRVLRRLLCHMPASTRAVARAHNDDTAVRLASRNLWHAEPADVAASLAFYLYVNGRTV